jgi:hypothetical protein
MHSYSPDIVAADPKDSHNIKVNLHELNQFFNSMDPSPFVEKDLDDDAEEFIVSWAQEFPLDVKLRLHVYLEQWPGKNPTEVIQQAVHNHFAHRSELTDLEFRHLMKQGRTCLLIGLSFLVACLAISETLLLGEAGTWAAVLRESLTIAGWVAMWRPMQIYLYDWWPLHQRSRIYAKLSEMQVDVMPQGRT